MVKFTNVSEKSTVSTFGVEEQAEHAISKQRAEVGLCSDCYLLLACLPYFSALKMDTVHFSETSVNLKQSVLRHI
jgi:hypothetical protein